MAGREYEADLTVTSKWPSRLPVLLAPNTMRVLKQTRHKVRRHDLRKNDPLARGAGRKARACHRTPAGRSARTRRDALTLWSTVLTLWSTVLTLWSTVQPRHTQGQPRDAGTAAGRRDRQNPQKRHDTPRHATHARMQPQPARPTQNTKHKNPSKDLLTPPRRPGLGSL